MSDSNRRNFKIIKDNPFISQRELAEAIGLSKTQRSKHYFRINTKEKHVMGKAYVLNQDYPIVCIGAAMYASFMCIKI